MYAELKAENLETNTREAAAGSLELTSLPVSVYVDVNLKCNLRCPQCHRNHPQFEGHVWPTMEFDLFENVARELFPTAYRVLMFGGGESLIHKNIDRMLQMCLDYEVYPTIVTNGTTMNRKRAVLVARTGMYMGISVDGATRKTFESLRYPAKWERFNKSMRLIKEVREEIGNPSFFPHIQVVVQRENVDEIPLFVELARQYGFKLVKFSKMFPHFEELKARIPEAEPVNEKFVEAFEKANEYGIRLEVPDYGPTEHSERLAELRAANVFPISIDSSPSGRFVQGGFVKYPDASSRRCGIPFSESMITPEGKVVVGCCSTYQLGDLAESDFATVWNGEGYRMLRRTVNSGEMMEFCAPGRCPFRI